MDLFIFLEKFNFFAGVPDSFLAPVVDYLIDKYSISKNHIITANEGNAVGVATGYFLSTGKIPVVYLQNSGIGNIINPVASLLNKDVYDIPCLFLIGWRGQPGTKDEPQHVFQGEKTVEMLKSTGIIYFYLKSNQSNNWYTNLFNEIESLLKQNKQVAIIIEKDVLEHNIKHSYKNDFKETRESVLETILNYSKNDILVTTTGKTSREIYELRETRNEEHKQDFLTVGSMGHTSSIALGIALQKPLKRVWCIDGDGAMLMHMGALAVVGQNQPKNFIHILINNEAHESVGGAPTVSSSIDWGLIAKGCGYNKVYSTSNLVELENILSKESNISIKENNSLVFIEIKTAIGSRADLGRPKESPKNIKINFMEFI